MAEKIKVVLKMTDLDHICSDPSWSSRISTLDRDCDPPGWSVDFDFQWVRITELILNTGMCHLWAKRAGSQGPNLWELLGFVLAGSTVGPFGSCSTSIDLQRKGFKEPWGTASGPPLSVSTVSHNPSWSDGARFKVTSCLLRFPRFIFGGLVG